MTKYTASRCRLNRLQEAGICRFCLKTGLTTTVACQKCAAMYAAKINQKRIEARQNNICVRCLCRPASLTRKRCEKCIAAHKIVLNKHRIEERKLVVAHYGNQCVVCHESRYPCLELDHINNDGAEHRESLVTPVASWLIKNDFPPIIQVLCANCHKLKHYENGMRFNMRGAASK